MHNLSLTISINGFNSLSSWMIAMVNTSRLYFRRIFSIFHFWYDVNNWSVFLLSINRYHKIQAIYMYYSKAYLNVWIVFVYLAQNLNFILYYWPWFAPCLLSFETLHWWTVYIFSIAYICHLYWTVWYTVGGYHVFEVIHIC